MESFGKWLRHKRRELDLTQDELAQRVGCAPITIRKLEGDEMHPSKQLAESISEQLGISLNQRKEFVRFARNHPSNELSGNPFTLEYSHLKGKNLEKGLEPELPTGTLSLLFSNIVGNPQLIQSLGEKYVGVLEELQPILLDAFNHWNGHVVNTQGDSFFVVFTKAVDAIAAAIECQQALANRHGENGAQLELQMGIHTGEPMLSNNNYVGVDVHRVARICTAAYPGQVLLSEETRVLVERHLPEHTSLRGLGKFWLKDLDEPEDIFQLVIAGLPSEFPPLKSLEVMPNNLPIQFTSFIGRELEITEITRLLKSSRLITLTGAGGTGKTRLAIEVAGKVLNQYTDGAWLIDFAALRDPSLVQQTLSSALRIREEPNRPLIKTIMDFLRPKNLLLLFDNCEHLVAPCAEMVDTLLENCPNVHILVTSREALGIAGENHYHIPSLSLVDTQSEFSMEQLNKSEAVQVFLDRAIMVQPTITLTMNNASAIAQICQRLDGIPLAIELAAARTKTLSVEQIEAHLDDRFRLLNAGNRAALPRQQTLRATMDWSFNLLSENERNLFIRLSVFASGWTLEAAQEVCSNTNIKTPEILELLMNLVDKSLVSIEDRKDETRYHFLETIREYAREKLSESGEEELFRSNHFIYYKFLAEIAEQKFKGGDQLLWLGIMESERGNLRSARDYASRATQPELSLQFVGTAFWLWFFRGPWSEGQQWAEEVSARSPGERTLEQAKALMAAGLFNFLQSDYSRARSQLHKSLDLWKDIEDPWWCSFVLAFLGRTMRGSDQERASELFKESLYFAQETKERWILAFSLWNAGEHELHLKNLPEANRFLDESLQLSRALEDRMLQNEILRALGGIAELRQEYDQAVDLYRQSLTIVHELGDTTTISAVQYDLGRAMQLAGNNDEAARHFNESLQWSQRLGKKAGMLRALAGLGVVAEARGQADRAVRMLISSKVLFGKLGINFSSSPDPQQSAWVEKSLASAQRQLGETAFDHLRIEGEALTLIEAVNIALMDDEEIG